MKKQKWGIGDVFLVPTKDGNFSVAQVVGHEPEAMNSVTCAFFDIKVSNEKEMAGISDLPFSRVFSVLFVTRDLLDRSIWKVAGERPVRVPRENFPFESLRSVSFVGAWIIGSRNIGEFVNAFYGLMPWDDWKDPNYLDSLLLSPEKKPTKLLFKKRT